MMNSTELTPLLSASHHVRTEKEIKGQKKEVNRVKAFIKETPLGKIFSGKFKEGAKDYLDNLKLMFTNPKHFFQSRTFFPSKSDNSRNKGADPDNVQTQSYSPVSVTTLFKGQEVGTSSQPTFFSGAITETKSIEHDYTLKTSIDDQKTNHEVAKAFLKSYLPFAGAKIEFIRPPSNRGMPQAGRVKIRAPLDRSVFKMEYTKGVKEDMKRDANRQEDTIVIYGAASQANGCEAPDKYTVAPGEAKKIYEKDPTQGPQAQLAYSGGQVELINCAGNMGFNGVVNILDEKTKGQIAHGYFTPDALYADQVVQQLEANLNRAEYPMVAAVPTGGKKEVHMVLAYAPAFGGYDAANPATQEQKEQIQFAVALAGFRAQFKAYNDLAIQEKKPVVGKPCAVGLGVFGNDPEVVAKAYYLAGKEFESEFKKNNVEVRLQVFNRGEGPATGKAADMAKALGFKL